MLVATSYFKFQFNLFQVDSNHVVACDDEKTLVVQQVRCEDSNERLKVVYPSKTDLVSLAPLIKVIR